jgi:hypothetical protein
MKVFSCPDAVPFAEPDYRSYDSDREEEREKQHLADLTAWLRANGWAGPRTGETLNLQIADGFARYMLADGQFPALVHLPYGDGYSSPLASALRYDEVAELVDREKALAAIFASHGAA